MAKPLVQLQNPFASKWEVTAACLDDGHDQLALAYKDGKGSVEVCMEDMMCVDGKGTTSAVGRRGGGGGGGDE